MALDLGATEVAVDVKYKNVLCLCGAGHEVRRCRLSPGLTALGLND